MQNETIASLAKANKALLAREEGYKESILTLSNSLEAKTASVTRLLLRIDNLKREIADLKRDVKELQNAVLELGKKQKRNTKLCDRFEAGYFQKIGE